MYYGEFTSLRHKNYVEGKQKIWLPWKPRLLFISISQGKNNIQSLKKQFFYYIYHLNMINSNLQHTYVLTNMYINTVQSLNNIN